MSNNNLNHLLEGNQRFLDERSKQKGVNPKDLTNGQSPRTVVLTCADSRVPPELIFDKDLGELFVIRIAGNSATDEAIGSAEYAVAHLGAKEVIVMGHSRCGAVAATVDFVQKGEPLPTEALQRTVAPIVPAVVQTLNRKGLGSEKVLTHSIDTHAQRMVSALKDSPVLGSKAQSGDLVIRAMRYSLETGEARLLP